MSLSTKSVNTLRSTGGFDFFCFFKEQFYSGIHNKIHLFQVYNSMMSSKFTKLHNHHQVIEFAPQFISGI